MFDTTTLQQVTRIQLSERPNKIVVNKKHKKIYAAIRNRANGKSLVDVIDIPTHKLVRSIQVHHPVHNTYVTPDDNFVVAGLSGDPEPGDPTIQVIDTATDKVVWGMELKGPNVQGRDNHEVRPMAFEANPDGSTKRMFAQAAAINGVWVIDWATHKVVDILYPPELKPWHKNADGVQGAPMHGVEVLPNRSAVWASSRLDSRIYGWTLPDLKNRCGAGGANRQLDDADAGQPLHVRRDSGADHTVVVDLQKRAVVNKIKTGARPARNHTAILPLNRVNTTTTASNATQETTQAGR